MCIKSTERFWSSLSDLKYIITPTEKIKVWFKLLIKYDQRFRASPSCLKSTERFRTTLSNKYIIKTLKGLT